MWCHASRWLSHLIRMTNGECSMSSGWHNDATLSHPDYIAEFIVAWVIVDAGCHPDGLRCCSKSSGWHNLIQSHPDELALGHISSEWVTDIAVRHPGDSWYCLMSSGWHGVIWTLSHQGELVPGRLSDDIWPIQHVIRMNTLPLCVIWIKWLSWSLYLIQMSYRNVIMSLEWHTLSFLIHLDEILDFDFSQHAVALQRFRIKCHQCQFQDSVPITKCPIYTFTNGVLKLKITCCYAFFRVMVFNSSGGRLNKKDGLTRYDDSHVKDKTS